MSTVRRSLGLAFVALAIASFAAAPADAQDDLAGAIVELRLDGVVDPFVADYVEEQIGRAEDQGAAAVVLTIDTPGGLDSSMRQITQAILSARVPVIGYVSPEGARAASAGTFILLSTSVAAMAPATNVGAAQPVGLSGAIASEKAVNDAATYIRSIAEERGRDPEWADSAVRESASATAEQALRLGVIDVIATDIGSLIETIDGRDVPVANGQTLTLDLAGAPIREVNPGPLVGFLHAVLDPNVAFIFFWFGLALIVLELFLPGGVAGTLGTVMFVLSLVALGMLPVQLIGVLLLVGSVVFFVLELMHPGVGALAAGGVIALVLGGLFLFDSSVPGVAVSPLVIVPVTAFALFFFLVVIRSAIKLRTKKAITRDEQLVGRAGVVVRDLDPAGVVQVASEQWSAETAGGTLRAGDRVRVVGMQGLKLKVEPVDEPAPVASASAEGREP